MTAPISDAQLTAAFGPSDPATDAMIAASLVLHRATRRELDDLTAGLAIGVAEFARRVRAVEQQAGVR